MSTVFDSSQRSAAGSPSQQLAEEVRRRLSRGLAPPREAYLVHNRRMIDWSQAPEWARPIDPELFDGCGHEG